MSSDPVEEIFLPGALTEGYSWAFCVMADEGARANKISSRSRACIDIEHVRRIAYNMRIERDFSDSLIISTTRASDDASAASILCLRQ